MYLRREDLEDLLVDPAYFQAIFHSLEQVKALYQAQAELGMANEAIARTSIIAVLFEGDELIGEQNVISLCRTHSTSCAQILRMHLTRRNGWKGGGGTSRGSSGMCIRCVFRASSSHRTLILNSH